MKYSVVIQQGPTSFAAIVPDLPGVYAIGKTRDETRALIAGAIDLHIRGLLADGDDVPEPSLSTELFEVST